ncbi:MAG TPA: hypothetical protein VK841_19015 [Polyangiaceae bacterium]|jgi:hypothetical protein|nr:hypothetical protein [Polyangiaceae bacterium]
MRPSRSGFALAAIALASAGCGAQVVTFTVDTGDGGSAATDATSGTANVGDAAASDSSTPFPGFDAGGFPMGHHDAATVCTCVTTMGACMSNDDCCDGDRCLGNICVPPASVCWEPGMSCQPPISCCSGRCEPTGPGGSPVCAKYCLPDKSACSAATDCCSLACVGGSCGGAICSEIGFVCQLDSDCCSGQCTGSHCAQPLAANCLPSGESCGDAGVACCSGMCNETGRCGVSGAWIENGICLAPASPCSRIGFTNCCDNGMCLFSQTAHVPTCQTEGAQGVLCTPDTQRCLQDSDCCSKTCTSGLCGSSCSPF